MAHYAQINNNIVQSVLVTDNNWTDQEAQDWLAANVGGTWVQTSFNNNIRKQFAGVGMTYDVVKDKFISPQPYASWALDVNDDWQSPTPVPAEGMWQWDEDTLAWVEVTQ